MCVSVCTCTCSHTLMGMQRSKDISEESVLGHSPYFEAGPLLFLLLCSEHQTRWPTSFQAILAVGAMGLQTCATESRLYMGSGNPNTGCQLSLVSAFTKWSISLALPLHLKQSKTKSIHVYFGGNNNIGHQEIQAQFHSLQFPKLNVREILVVFKDPFNFNTLMLGPGI